MKDLHPAFAAARWPGAADAAQAALGRERWSEGAGSIADAAAAAFARGLARSRAGQAVLDAVGGNSPFLTECLLAEPEFSVALLRDGPDAAFAALLAEADRAFAAERGTAAVMRLLRIAKRRAALTIALADIAGAWPLERVTAALSDLAEHALTLAARHLMAEAVAAGALPAGPDPTAGLIVLGMGKLGGRELNYSSDIDLIILYDRDRLPGADPDALAKLFVRIARNLVRIMGERDREGYVFRTDLRLRPDPAATPLALSVNAAETYYESLGQNWERAAMIKARPVAGDIEAGRRFLGALRPYVWRRNLDFAAIQDIHSIKRQINAHHGGGTVELAGHNIKIGRGGIREIEFFAQTQQLIWGGRTPELRVAPTCEALRALAAAGRVEAETAEEMIAAYRFLRGVEHRLQMVADQQTHSLPEDEAGLAAIAAFLGFASRDAFADALLGQLRTVERHYAHLFEDAPALGGPGNLVFTGTENDPGTLRTLQTLGFKGAATVSETVRGWHHGRYRAMRSARARELLTEIMPALLAALSKTPNPDQAFIRFDAFLAGLPAGVQLFSLFHANPSLLDLVAEIMGAAPRLAEALSRNAALLDAVLSPDFFAGRPDRAALEHDMTRALAQARDFEDVLDITRRWANERKFQVGVQMLRGARGPQAAGRALADIADTVLRALQPAVEEEFARQHGRLPGGSLAIVALGKLGGREMTFTSDLDLILVYDVPDEVESSDGARPLSPAAYYARLAARLINAITALTGEGRLYDIDTRLRPSGSKGPIAVDLSGFVAYQRNDAWTWEHMALTRARTVTGDPALRQRLAEAIGAVIGLERDPAKLRADVAEMRARMAREHPGRSPWEIKTWRGGLIDIEFIAQYLELAHAHAHPALPAASTAAALEHAREAGVLDPAQAGLLLDALRLWQAVQGMLRLTVEGSFDPATCPAALGAKLATAAGAVDFATLEATIIERSAAVQAIFDAIVGSGP